MVGLAGMRRLARARVAVFGMGGVGSHCAEALARSGLGALRIVDHDTVSESNCNRQLHALQSTLGRRKVDVMRSRLLDIAPELEVAPRHEFFAAETAEVLLGGDLDYVVDAIDALGPKVELLQQCRQRKIRVVTALGAAGRLDPTEIRVAPLEQTRDCSLAATVRKQMRRRGGLDGVLAVFSVERLNAPAEGDWPRMTEDLFRGRQRVIQPSMVMVPAAMGYAAASVVVRDLV
jgi:tRNA A37 threonylcarbamoyladenosine dehydratase